MFRSVVKAAVPLVLIGLSAGCRDKNLGTLRGRVTLDGQTVPSGAIILSPIDRNSRTASCMIRDGEYTVDLPANKYRVSISSPQAIGGSKSTGNATLDDGPQVRDSIPAKYNEGSEITVDVVAGANEKNFELAADKK